MKKIYFACSIRGGRDDAATYKLLVDYIKVRSDLLMEIFADEKLTAVGMNKPADEIWKIDTEWVQSCDGLIAEVSNPSLGVGYEIAKAEEWGKPVLALYCQDSEKQLSAMIAGSPNVQTVYYENIDQAYIAISKFIDEIK